MAACIPVSDRMATAATVRGENGLFVFQHENFLAEYSRANRGARAWARQNQAILAEIVYYPKKNVRPDVGN